MFVCFTAIAGRPVYRTLMMAPVNRPQVAVVKTLPMSVQVLFRRQYRRQRQRPTGTTALNTYVGCYEEVRNGVDGLICREELKVADGLDTLPLLYAVYVAGVLLMHISRRLGR